MAQGMAVEYGERHGSSEVSHASSTLALEGRVMSAIVLLSSLAAAPSSAVSGLQRQQLVTHLFEAAGCPAMAERATFFECCRACRRR
jgi:hypothetical protein